jgi:hypothetical protein
MTVANWRDLVKVHPAADIFPMLSDAELDALAKDIDEDILRVPLSLWRAREGADWQLLDGRNRVAAMARLVDGVARIEGAIGFANTYEAHVDPWAFAISANILRRHLTAEQKRKVVADLLLADPTRSNRAIAALAKASDHVVANVRNDLEHGARIAHHAERVGKDGIAQPAHKPPVHRQPAAAIVNNTTPRPAPVSKVDQARQLREQRFASVPTADPARLLAAEIEAFRILLKDRRPHAELIERRQRLRLARGLVVALGVDPAELAGDAP